MKLVILSCLVLSVLAEPPRFRPARFRYQRLELVPTTTDAPMTTTDADVSGPYPPSGWKPAGQAFELPTTTQSPADTYGPPEAGPYPPSGWKPAGEPFALPQEQQLPSTSYGVPDNTYGVPDNTYGTPAAPTTDNPQAEKLDGPVEVQKSVGTYYILLPNGQLQQVQFVTENDLQKMRYTARLELRDRAPLYVFRN